MARTKKQILTEYLVHQAQQGGSKSFQRLYELWNQDLYRYAAVRIQDPTAASDIVQEVWVDIAKNLRKLNDPGCFPRWAFQIVVRKTVDWIRREQRQRKHQAAFASEIDRSSPQASSSQAAIELKDDLQVALSKLPETQREILHLFYLSELDVSEIADVFQIPKGTVKSRLFHARASLKEVMEG